MTNYSLEKQESNSVQSHINVAKELDVPDTPIAIQQCEEGTELHASSAEGKTTNNAHAIQQCEEGTGLHASSTEDKTTNDTHTHKSKSQAGNKGVATVPLLYQIHPREKSRNPSRVPTSHTESKESSQKASNQEAWILENNHRFPKHEIELRYFVELPIDVIRANWRRLQRKLKEADIIYAAAIELTTIGNYGLPNNRVHYHFLIDSGMSRKTLMDTMKTACQKAKLGVYGRGRDFDLTFPNHGIFDWMGKIKYFTKSGYPDNVHLFDPAYRVQKFYYSSKWFVEADGTPTTRQKILKRIKAEYKEKKKQQVASVAPCPVAGQLPVGR